MTIAAVRCLAFTAAISSAVMSADVAGAAVSPWGPLLRTLPLTIAASAFSALCTAALSLPEAAPEDVALVELHPARPNTRALVTAMNATLRLMSSPVDVRDESRGDNTSTARRVASSAQV